MPCATDRSIGLPELRHCKRHFQTDPDVKFRKPDCCCAAPGGRKHVKLRKWASTKVRCQGPASMYVDTVINFAKYHIHTTYIHTYYMYIHTTYILRTYYVQNERSHSLLLNSVQARQLLNSVQARQKSDNIFEIKADQKYRTEIGVGSHN